MKLLNILKEIQKSKKNPCWKGYKQLGTKEKNGKTVPNCIPIKEYTVSDEETGCFITELQECIKDTQNLLLEAQYQGRTVQLNKPTRGDVKKFKVYVKNDKGNIVKVNFGDPNMKIKKSNPKRRKAFRARHRCDTPGPKWKARYWSCKKW